MKRKISTVVIAICIGLVSNVAISAPSYAAGKDNDKVSSQKIFNLTNNLRKSNKVSKLETYNKLDDVAYKWSKVMAIKQKMFHNPKVAKEIPPTWSAWGENVAYACGYGDNTATVIFNTWANSPGHYKNMTNPNFNTIGVGTYMDKNGCMWAVQNFGKYKKHSSTQKVQKTVTTKASGTYSTVAYKTITTTDSNGNKIKKRVSKTFKKSYKVSAKVSAKGIGKASSFNNSKEAKELAKKKAAKVAKASATKKAIKKARTNATKKAKSYVNSQIVKWKKS